MTTTNANPPRSAPKPVMVRGFGGLSAGPMPAADRAWIARETRTRCGQRSAMAGPVHALTERQIGAATALAVDLYETAEAYGIDRGTADGVTSFIDAAIDGIRARDRR